MQFSIDLAFFCNKYLNAKDLKSIRQRYIMLLKALFATLIRNVF